MLWFRGYPKRLRESAFPSTFYINTCAKLHIIRCKCKKKRSKNGIIIRIANKHAKQRRERAGGNSRPHVAFFGFYSYLCDGYPENGDKDFTH